MYIEQLKKYHPSLLLYLPLPLGFILLMVLNYISTMEIDTTELLNQMVIQFGENITFVLLVAPLSLGLLVVWFWTKFVQNIKITILTTAREKIDFKRILFSFFVWGLVIAVGVLISYYSNPEDFVLNFKPLPFLIFFILALLLIPMQTSFEEYLFRAHMMQGLGLATKNKWIPLLVTSVLFGIMHAANPEVAKVGWVIMAFYIGTGFFLGIITLMDDGLELALGFHAANNLFVALLVTSDWTVFQTNSIFKQIGEPAVGFEIIFPLLIQYPLMLFVFSKKYKWSGWKEKLTGKV